MKATTKILGALFLCLLIGQVSFGQTIKKAKPGKAGSWQILGTVQAKFTADHDAIIVVGPFDNFRKIKFKVTNAPLKMVRMTVTYGNGTTEKIDTRFNIPKGGESRIIDLKGGSRKIKRVDFWYETKGLVNGRANVTLFGRK
jgi:hypothetical protein